MIKLFRLMKQAVLVQAIPNAQLVVFPQCGHWVQIEKTKEFAGQVIDFFKAIS